MGQTRRHRAERNEFFSLLRVAFQVPHPVRSRAKNLACDCWAGDQHAPEALFIEPEQSSRLRYAAHREPRYVQQQHGFAEVVSGFVDAQEDRLAIICARGANFALENYMEKTRAFSFGGQHCADRRLDYLASVQASQLLLGQLGEEGA